MDFAKKPQSFLAQRIDEKNRMKDSVTGHRTGLTERLLKLFAPRPPLESVPVPPPKPKAVPLSGIAQYMDKFAGPGDPEYHGAQEIKEETRLFRSPELQYQARIDVETLPERDIRLAAEAQAAAAAAIREGLETWDPTKDPNVQGDPFKTLFVGRLSYDTSERKLRREMEEFGPIRRIRIVHDRNTGKPRGYAFVEFEHKNDMKQAYKLAEGRKVEDRRILVDVERGRAVTGWLSRRFGGGKGGESRAPRLPKDPRRLMVRRMIERYLQERREAGIYLERAKEPPPASPERGGAETRTAEAAPHSASRGREESGPRAPAHDRLPREVSRDRRSRSADRGRGLGRSSSPPTRPRERSADLASGDDSEREAGEIADAPNDFGRERSRDRSRNGHGDGERHSDRKGGTFRSVKTVPMGSKGLTLKQHIEHTLGTGTIEEAVRLPPGEDINKWLAVNTVFFYNALNVLYQVLDETLCTAQRCPTMSAGPQYEYLWADGVRVKHPVKLSAPAYVNTLFDWVEEQLDNPAVFPQRYGAAFPRDFLNTVKTILKRLFRVYAHIYHSHFKQIVRLELEPHLHTCFKHFVLFTKGNRLIDDRELAPMKELIDKLTRGGP